MRLAAPGLLARVAVSSTAPSKHRETGDVMDHALATSWDRTRAHLAAAAAHLVALSDLDLASYQEYLDYNELGLAFDHLVDLGHDLELRIDFWLALDRAAKEMRLYSEVIHTPHLTSADFCRRHVAAAAEADEGQV